MSRMYSNGVRPIGDLIDSDLTRYLMRFTERELKTALVFPPLGPINIKSICVQAKLFNLEVISLGSEYASTVAVCRKSYLKNRKYKSFGFLNKISNEELKLYENSLMDTISDFHKRYICYNEEDTEILSPVIPTYVGIDRNVLFADHNDETSLEKQVLYCLNSANVQDNIESEEVDINDLHNVYNPARPVTDNFIAGAFYNYDNLSFEEYIKYIKDDVYKYLNDFEIVMPIECYNPYLSYASQILSHVVEVQGIDPKWTKRNIGQLFSFIQKRQLSIFKCNPTHYLIAFRGARAAEEACKLCYPGVRINRLTDCSPLGALIAARYDLFAYFREY